MAKYESTLRGDFRDILVKIEQGILQGSATANLEDGSDYEKNGVRLAVRVYERYSMLGGNRLSLSVTLLDAGNGEVFLSAVTSGGSQAMFFKVNRFGEGAFLEKLMEIVRDNGW